MKLLCRTSVWMIVAGGWLCLPQAGAFSARADDQPPSQAPPTPPSAPASSPTQQDAPGQATQAEPGTVGRDNADRLRRAARNLIERRLEQTRQAEARLQRALARLDGGATLEDLRDEFPELQRQGRGDNQDWPSGPGRMDGADSSFPTPPARGNPSSRSGTPLGGPDFNELGPSPDGMGPGPKNSRSPRHDGPLTSDQRQAIRDFLRSASPGMLPMIERLERDDPAEAEKRFAEMLPRVRFLIEMREREPELYNLKLQDIRLGRESVEAARRLAELDKRGPGAEPGEITGQSDRLRTALSEQYDVRGQILAHEVSRLQERQAEVAKEIQGRPARRDEVVQKMMSTLVEREKQRMERRGGDGRHKPDDGDRPGRPPASAGANPQRPGQDESRMNAPNRD